MKISRRRSYALALVALLALFIVWLFFGFSSIPRPSDGALDAGVEFAFRDLIVSSGFKCPVVVRVRTKEENSARTVYSVFCGDRPNVSRGDLHYRVVKNAGRGTGGSVQPW